MAVYMIIEVTVLDPEVYDRYMELVPATVEAHGGTYVVRSSDIRPLTGDWRPDRLIVLEFPTFERMIAWNTSPEYQNLAPLRATSTVTRAIAVEGAPR